MLSTLQVALVVAGNVQIWYFYKSTCTFGACNNELCAYNIDNWQIKYL